MTSRETVAYVRGRLAVIAGGLARAMGVLWRVLTFNLLEGVVIPKRYLCAVPGKGSVSIAYGSRFMMKPRVHGFKRYSFDHDGYITPEHLADAVRLAVDEFGVRRARMVLALPMEWAVVRAVELPAVVKENLTSVMEYELDRLTPFNPSEALYDFVLCGEEEGTVKITLMAVRTDIVRPYLDALGGKGMYPERITVGAAAFGTLCGIFSGGNESLCLRVGAEAYEGCHMREGTILHCFRGELSGSDQESNLAQMKEELKPLLDAMQERDVIPQVFFSSGPGYTSPNSLLGLPVRVLNREDIKVTLKVDGDNSAMEPLGGLLEMIGPVTAGLNLVSRGSPQVRRTPLRMTAVLGCLVVAALIPYVIMPLEVEKRKLEVIDHQVKIRKDEVRKVEALIRECDALDAEVTAIQGFGQSGYMVLSIMKELTLLLPKSVWLTRSRITEGTAELEGYARSATEILPLLEQSGIFKKVEFASPTIRDTRLNADRFVIKTEIEGVERKK